MGHVLLLLETVSEICEAHGIQPILFYRWQKNMFDNAHAVFLHKNNVPRERVHERKINELEGKLAHKDTVIAEIVERGWRLEQKREERRQLWIAKRKNSKKMPLTKMILCENIENAGQTETGSAGEQPVRDVRAVVLKNVEPGVTVAPGNQTENKHSFKTITKPQKTRTLNEISN